MAERAVFLDYIFRTEKKVVIRRLFGLQVEKVILVKKRLEVEA